MSTVEQLSQYFKASFAYVVAEGDRLVMLAALYNRKESPDLYQERTKRPSRTRVIQKKLKKEFSIPGLPKWGATAVRGDLMDTKEHIRKFIDYVNELPATDLEDAWQACGHAYRTHMEEKHVPIQLNPEESLLAVLADLSTKRSGGRIQQPLCYSALAVLFESLSGHFEVTTKKVFAGDAQSGMKGDIEIRLSGRVVAAFEIKAHVVDDQKIRVPSR